MPRPALHFSRSIASLLLALSLLSGCVTTGPREMLLRPKGAAEAKNIVFPPQAEGDVPRFIYLGELIGDSNFYGESGKPGLTGRDIANFLLGGLLGEAEQRFLSRPQSILVDAQGRVLITDFGRGGILVFDEKKGSLDEWRIIDKTRRFLAPVAITQGPEGSFFVSDADHALIAHLDASGKPLAILGQGQLTRPTGIAYEAETKRLFVVDTQAHHIKVFDVTGRLLDVWGERGEEADQPRNKTRDTDDLIFNLPSHLTVSKGKLYIADTMNARVQVVSSKTGKPIDIIGSRGIFVGNLIRPKGIAVDSEDNIYVIEGYHDHLLVFNQRGQFLMPIGGEGINPGQFNLPTGIYIDKRDRVFIADAHNARVQVFQFLGGSGNAAGKD